MKKSIFRMSSVLIFVLIAALAVSRHGAGQGEKSRYAGPCYDVRPVAGFNCIQNVNGKNT